MTDNTDSINVLTADAKSGISYVLLNNGNV